MHTYFCVLLQASCLVLFPVSLSKNNNNKLLICFFFFRLRFLTSNNEQLFFADGIRSCHTSPPAVQTGLCCVVRFIELHCLFKVSGLCLQSVQVHTFGSELRGYAGLMLAFAASVDLAMAAKTAELHLWFLAPL